jgi:hypothetical protein
MPGGYLGVWTGGILSRLDRTIPEIVSKVRVLARFLIR